MKIPQRLKDFAEHEVRMLAAIIAAFVGSVFFAGGVMILFTTSFFESLVKPGLQCYGTYCAIRIFFFCVAGYFERYKSQE